MLMIKFVIKVVSLRVKIQLRTTITIRMINYWYACLRISFNVEVCHNIIVKHFECFWKCPQPFGLGSGTRGGGGGGGGYRSLKPLQVFGCWPSGAVAAVTTSSSAGSSCRGLSSSFGGLSLNPLSGVGLDAGDEIVGRVIPLEAGSRSGVVI